MQIHVQIVIADQYKKKFTILFDIIMEANEILLSLIGLINFNE